MKITPILALSAFLMISCKKETASETPENNVDGVEAVENHNGHDHEGHDHEGHNHAEQAPSADAPKLNPPHGEPGHRCEIPVGAPLDGSAMPKPEVQPAAPAAGGAHFLNNGGQSANAQTSNPYSVSNNNTVTPDLKDLPQNPQAAPQTTAPGMKGKPNPAHGQPGHRCDVQVGQPLP